MTRREQAEKEIIHYLACRPDFEGVSLRDIELCKWAVEWADKNPAMEPVLDILSKNMDIVTFRKYEASLKEREQLSVATNTFGTICRNSCCEQCQQAKLVAKQALEKIKGMEKK